MIWQKWFPLVAFVKSMGLYHHLLVTMCITHSCGIAVWKWGLLKECVDEVCTSWISLTKWSYDAVPSSQVFSDIVEITVYFIQRLCPWTYPKTNLLVGSNLGDRLFAFYITTLILPFLHGVVYPLGGKASQIWFKSSFTKGIMLLPFIFSTIWTVGSVFDNVYSCKLLSRVMA